MHVTDEDLCELTRNTCESMLGLPLQSAEECSLSAPNVAASVRISGEWNAIVQVGGSESTARKIASAMFSQPAEDLSNTDIMDAFAEIANMVGGNVKGMFDGECQLSLPCVDNDADLSQWRGSDPAPQWFLLADEPLGVRLLELATTA